MPIKLLRTLCAISLLLFVTNYAHAETPVTTINLSGVEQPAWVLEDETSPLFVVNIRFQGGISNDKNGQEGLTSLWNDLVLRGTTGMDFATMVTYMKDHAIDIALSSGRDDTILSLKAPYRYKNEAITLLHDVVQNPKLDSDELTRLKEVYLSSIQSNLGNVNWRGQRIINGLAYKNSPYAKPGSGSLQSIKSMTLDDIKTRHAVFLAQSPEHLVAVGHITKADLEKITSIWDKKAVSHGDKDNDYRNLNKTVKTHHPFDVTQTELNYVIPALPSDHPDFAAQSVLEFMLSNGFGAPLMKALREESGLSYGVSSYITSSDHGGLWVTQVDVPPTKVNDAVTIIENTFEHVIEGTILTDTDLAEAKHAITASLPMGWTSSGAIAGALMGAYDQGFTPDYLNEWSAMINKITIDDIRRVAKNLLLQDNKLIVSVGAIKPDAGWTTMDDLPNM